MTLSDNFEFCCFCDLVIQLSDSDSARELCCLSDLVIPAVDVAVDHVYEEAECSTRDSPQCALQRDLSDSSCTRRSAT